MSNALLLGMASAKVPVRDSDRDHCKAATAVRRRVDTLVRAWVNTRHSCATQPPADDHRTWFFDAIPIAGQDARSAQRMSWRLRVGTSVLGAGSTPEAAMYSLASELYLASAPLTADAAAVLREVLFP